MPEKTAAPSKKESQQNSNFVRIYIDPQLTRGGLRTFDEQGGVKLYIGWVNVPEDIAQDLQRRIDEIREIHDAMTNPRQKIRIKNFEVIERLFLADPEAYEKRKGWSKEYGLLDPWQWQHLTPVAQERLIATRKQLYPHLYQ